LRSFQPALESCLIPDDARFAQLIRILEARHRSRFASDNAAESWTLLVVVERVAAGTASRENILAYIWIRRAAHAHQREQTKAKHRAQPHAGRTNGESTMAKGAF